MKNIPIRKISNASKESIITESFKIRDVASLLSGKDLSQELHRHDHLLIMALRKGRGENEVDFINYKIADHTFFFIRPGQVHRLELKKGSTGYLMQFNNGFYNPDDKVSSELLRKATAENICELNDKESKRLFDILEYIFQEYNEMNEGYQDIIKSNLKIFFIELVRHRKLKHTDLNQSALYMQNNVEKLFAFLEDNISKHKKVSDYASKLNLSSYQLNSITKTTLGKTCSELIDERIILESKRYLLATDRQVKEIAYELGYEDISYFIRFFKKQTGYSPEAFRQNFK